MHSWKWEKWKYVDKKVLILLFFVKKKNSSVLVSKIDENLYLLYLMKYIWYFLLLDHVFTVLFGYFFYVVRKKNLLELIKRRPNVHEKNNSDKSAVNFDQWQTFSEN